MTTPEQIKAALENVMDPEIGMNVVDLGLIYDTALVDGVAKITYTLTSPTCPFGPELEQEIIQYASVLDDVESVELELTFTPAWSLDMVSEDARFALGLEPLGRPADPDPVT
jgi:metal-sulfur cluster biosynthetic enzyme